MTPSIRMFGDIARTASGFAPAAPLKVAAVVVSKQCFRSGYKTDPVKDGSSVKAFARPDRQVLINN